MDDDLKHARTQVENALRDVLVKELPGRDPAEAVDTILDYVFHKQEVPQEADRYEWFYARLGLAVSVAQGWRKNVLPSLGKEAELRGSIETYVRDTYGVNYADYP